MFLYTLRAIKGGYIGINQSVCFRSVRLSVQIPVQHRHTVFGSWVYHYETMCHIHSWSWYDVDLWPQGQIYRVLTFLHVQPISSVWHWHIIFGTWVNLHDPNTTLTFWPPCQIYRSFDMALCSGHNFLVFWQSHTIFGTSVYHHGAMCHIHSEPLHDFDLWPQYRNYTFTMNVFVCGFSFFNYMEMSTLPVKGCNCKFWPMLGTHGAVMVL